MVERGHRGDADGQFVDDHERGSHGADQRTGRQACANRDALSNGVDGQAQYHQRTHVLGVRDMTMTLNG